MKRFAFTVVLVMFFALPCWAQQPISADLGFQHSRYVLSWKGGQFDTPFSKNHLNLTVQAAYPQFALRANVIFPRVEWVGTSDLSAGVLVVGNAVFERKGGGQGGGQGQQSNQQKPIDLTVNIKPQMNIEALVPTTYPGFFLVGEAAFIDLTVSASGEDKNGKQITGEEALRRGFAMVGLAYRLEQGPARAEVSGSAWTDASRIEGRLHWLVTPDIQIGIVGRRVYMGPKQFRLNRMDGEVNVGVRF